MKKKTFFLEITKKTTNMDQSNTIFSVSTETPKIPTSSPEKKMGASSLNTTSSQSIFTKQEKNNAFGEKLYVQVQSIYQDNVISQNIVDKILQLSEQEIVLLLVDFQKLTTIARKYNDEYQTELNMLQCNVDHTALTVSSEQKENNTPIVKEKCSICLDELGETNKSVTPCGHHFCFTCLYQAMEKQNNCPLCRSILIENKKKKMRKLSDEAMADIITETMNDFNLRRHIRSAELFSNNRNNMDSDDIICSSVQIYSLQLANNIQRQQINRNYYYDEESDEDESDEEEDEEEEEEE